MASFNYFLNVAGVTGGSRDAHHAGEFDALGYEFDLAAIVAASSGGGGGAGTTKFAPLIVDPRPRRGSSIFSPGKQAASTSHR